MADVDVSIVIPVYNSETCIEELVRRITEVMGTFKTCEIILVNDGSPDGSWDKIRGLCKTYNHIQGINLRKNFGQDNAIMAGFQYASGASVIVMDDDLQHDPQYIPDLINGLDKGYDACYAKFKIKKQNLLKNMGSWFNDKVANFILKKPKDVYLSPYKAIKKEVVHEILQYHGPYPYVDGLLYRITDNITQIDAEHLSRFAGKGNYNFTRSISVWLKLSTNFSVAPLRIASYMGLVAAAFGFCLGIFFIFRYLWGIQTPTGWPSLIITVSILGGIQLFAIGMVGEYVGRMFLQSSNKPQYVVRESIDRQWGRDC